MQLQGTPLSKQAIHQTGRNCQLYLVVETGAAVLERLSAALAAAPVASVLLKTHNSASADPVALKALVEACQKRGIATLVNGDAALARTMRADGVHLPWSPQLIADYTEARDILGNRYMIGVEIDPKSEAARHEAMELAEAGADYIGFSAGTGAGELSSQLDLVSWWAEIFEVPCVAFDVMDGPAAASFAATGVEFIAVPLAAAVAPADGAARMAEIAARVGARALQEQPT